jgi:hypothetical protein
MQIPYPHWSEDVNLRQNVGGLINFFNLAGLHDILQAKVLPNHPADRGINGIGKEN